MDDVNFTERNANSTRVLTETRRNSTPVLLDTLTPEQSEFAYRRGRRSSRLLLLADDDEDNGADQEAMGYAGADQGKKAAFYRAV